VFQLGVEFVAVAVEKILETLEQIGGKVGAIDGGVTVGGDSLQAIRDERLIV
jgi:hypothetical protein